MTKLRLLRADQTTVLELVIVWRPPASAQDTGQNLQDQNGRDAGIWDVKGVFSKKSRLLKISA